MKSIVDSKVLHNAIAKAINKETKKVTVTSTKLMFDKIKVPLQIAGNDNYGTEFDFNMYKWINVVSFLHTLSHQPIICEFDSETIRIDCVMEF